MRIFIALLFIGICIPSHAGNQAPAKPLFSAQEIVTFAKQVETYAAQKGAYAFILSRNGRPPAELPKGISYTHTAVAIYSAITTENGDVEHGYAIHNLYQRVNDLGTSDIVVDYPVDFFWGAKELKAGIIIPTPDIQQKLVALIADNKHLMLHNPKYSVVANPMNTKRQNCTEFTLDMLQSAIYDTLDTGRIKANNQAYFSPQQVKVSRMKLAFGSWVSEGVSLKDHKGKVKTATFTTIANFMQHYELATDVTELTFNATI